MKAEKYWRKNGKTCFKLKSFDLVTSYYNIKNGKYIYRGWVTKAWHGTKQFLEDAMAVNDDIRFETQKEAVAWFSE
jgi:hypothetical protein